LAIGVSLCRLLLGVIARESGRPSHHLHLLAPRHRDRTDSVYFMPRLRGA